MNTKVFGRPVVVVGYFGGFLANEIRWLKPADLKALAFGILGLNLHPSCLWPYLQAYPDAEFFKSCLTNG